MGREGHPVDSPIIYLPYLEAWIVVEEATRNEFLASLEAQMHEQRQHLAQSPANPDFAEKKLTALQEASRFARFLSDEAFSAARAESLKLPPANHFSSTYEETDSRNSSHIWMGVALTPAAPQELISLRLTKAVKISAVAPHSPATKSRLEIGDIFIKVEQHPVETPEAFLRAIWQFSAGSRVKLELLRNGKPLTVYVTLESTPTPKP